MYNLTVNTVGDIVDEDEDGAIYESEFVESITTDNLEEIERQLVLYYGLNANQLSYLYNMELLDTEMYTFLLTGLE